MRSCRRRRPPRDRRIYLCTRSIDDAGCSRTPQRPVWTPSRCRPTPSARSSTSTASRCHNARLKTGGLVLDKDAVDLARVADRADVWEKVVRKLHGRMMPPHGMPRPDEATLDSFAASLETSIDRVALGKPNPGRSPLHRLNRSEYAAAVRDILALDIDATSLLAGRRRGERVRQHRRRAEGVAVAARAVPDGRAQGQRAGGRRSQDDAGRRRSTACRRTASQEDHIEGLPLGTRGGILVRHNFPLDADLRIQRRPAAEHRRLRAGARVAARARDQHRRRARVSRGSRRAAGPQAVGHATWR